MLQDMCETITPGGCIICGGICVKVESQGFHRMFCFVIFPSSMAVSVNFNKCIELHS